MKLRPLLLLALLFSIAATTTKAQTAVAPASASWRFITEKNFTDFFYRITDCNSSRQLFLRVKNDIGQERVLDFTVEITADTKITRTISYTAAPASILEPDCNDKNKNKHLRIDLPASFNDQNIQVKIKLNN